MFERTRSFTMSIAFGLTAVAMAAAFWGRPGLGSVVSAQQVQAPLQAQAPLVDKFVLDDTIQPVSQGELERAIKRADADGAQALLIQMDTPGGLVDSMRPMVAAMMASRVPVIVFVSPSGARAGSAGFFLLEAADVAAMAPGTEAGAAHVVFEGGKPDETMMQKVENDAEAFLRSYVTQRNRNTDAAVEALKNSHSYTAQEALNQHLIDLVENNDAQLLAALDGRQVKRLDGSQLTLHLAGAHVAVLRPSLFLVSGALLIYLEFHSPGTIVPGALGTLMVVLAIFALNLLPIRFTAVMLLAAALVLLLLEAKFGGHGVLASAGILCLLFGTLTLVAAPVPEMGVTPWVALAVSVGFGGITAFLVRLAMRARKRKALIGADAMVGCRAVAMEPLVPEGHVLVEGEIWLAVSSDPAPKGAGLRVVSHEQTLLHVAPDVPAAHAGAAV